MYICLWGIYVCVWGMYMYVFWEMCVGWSMCLCGVCVSLCVCVCVCVHARMHFCLEWLCLVGWDWWLLCKVSRFIPAIFITILVKCWCLKVFFSHCSQFCKLGSFIPWVLLVILLYVLLYSSAPSMMLGVTMDRGTGLSALTRRLLLHRIFSLMPHLSSHCALCFQVWKTFLVWCLQI